MESRLITTLSKYLAPLVDLGKSRLETLAMLTLGTISARTVNLSNIAPERGISGVQIASTYRRLQRFFQHVRLPKDWAAQVVAAMVGWPGKRVLVLDRSNWKERILALMEGRNPLLSAASTSTSSRWRCPRRMVRRF